MPERPIVPQIIVPPKPVEQDPAVLTCHRFFAPVVVPEPTAYAPNGQVTGVTIMPRMGNFPCIKGKCMLWNDEKSECWDRTAAKGLALMGEFAYAKLNDVTIDGGGA